MIICLSIIKCTLTAFNASLKSRSTGIGIGNRICPIRICIWSLTFKTTRESNADWGRIGSHNNIVGVSYVRIDWTIIIFRKPRNGRNIRIIFMWFPYLVYWSKNYITQNFKCKNDLNVLFTLVIRRASGFMRTDKRIPRTGISTCSQYLVIWIEVWKNPFNFVGY